MNYLFAILLSLVLFGAGCTTAPLPSPVAPEPSATRGSTSLDLSGKGLTAIPAEIFSRGDLERLDLSNNKLTGAPSSRIAELKRLKYLDLSENALTGLSAELGRLDMLEVLDVSNNQLTGLPMELGNLTRLKVLDVSGNAYSVQDLEKIAERLTQTDIRR
jgi:Leucine-rich repeat (LRR) protein